MPNAHLPLPLSLYIHFPWCLKKCPYCDFNSHALKTELPEEAYIQALLQDLQTHTAHMAGRTLHSLFIGGGTPSLFSANAIATLLDRIQTLLPFPKTLEITLEANPGFMDQKQFVGFYQAGINRLSIGVQSFQQDKLKLLGRIHSNQEAQNAVHIAHQANIANLNIDLMFGLPHQTIDDALDDLHTAHSLSPTHISWYQLTLEPHTAFYHRPPVLPSDDTVWEMQTLGQHFLRAAGYKQYEISAYSQKNYACQHNTHYWAFGDYIGIGAGAHSKITDPKTHTLSRISKISHPKAYLKISEDFYKKESAQSFIAEQKTVPKSEIPFEFMLNSLRLYKKIPVELFTTRTGLDFATVQEKINTAVEQKLLVFNAAKKVFYTTPRGKRFLNDLLALFL